MYMYVFLPMLTIKKLLQRHITEMLFHQINSNNTSVWDLRQVIDIVNKDKRHQNKAFSMHYCKYFILEQFLSLLKDSF